MSETSLNTKKVVTLAYGCQMSERDAETLTEITAQKGYARSEEEDKADLIIINTCCVRETAENKILGKIGDLKRLKEKNPNLKIAVSGCMVQQPGALERLKQRAPHVDNQMLDRLPALEPVEVEDAEPESATDDLLDRSTHGTH